MHDNTALGYLQRSLHYLFRPGFIAARLPPSLSPCACWAMRGLRAWACSFGSPLLR